jgi:DNA-binding transcriptional MerR regulator
VYRRSDVEQVARIKHLLIVEGLTLAGARRRLDEEATPVAADAPVLDELIGRNARERLTEVKRGLRSILDLLSGQGMDGFQLGAPAAAAVRRSAPVRPTRPPVRNSRTRGSGARRKRAG